jgi:hypothetical protein
VLAPLESGTCGRRLGILEAKHAFDIRSNHIPRGGGVVAVRQQPATDIDHVRLVLKEMSLQRGLLVVLTVTM